MAAVFVVQDRKIISEYRKQYKYQRFDIARILIDTNGNSIEIHTSIFECEIRKKIKNKTKLKKTESLKKITCDKKLVEKIERPRRKSFTIFEKKTKSKELGINDILQNPTRLKFFKLFAAKECSVENIIFFEEVQNFKLLDDKKREERVIQMMEIFFESDSIHEINVSRIFLIALKERLEKKDFGDDFFDFVLSEVIQTNLLDTFRRFKISVLFQEMKQNEKRSSYFLY